MARWQQKYEAAMRLANDPGATQRERAVALAKADHIRYKHLPNESQSFRKRRKSLWLVEHSKSDRQLYAEQRVAERQAREERRIAKQRERERSRQLRAKCDHEERCNRVYGIKKQGKSGRSSAKKQVRMTRGDRCRSNEGKGEEGSGHDGLPW